MIYLLVRLLMVTLTSSNNSGGTAKKKTWHSSDTITAAASRQAPKMKERKTKGKHPRTISIVCRYIRLWTPLWIIWACFNPFRTAVPFWGQTTQLLSSSSPKRVCGSKGVKTKEAEVKSQNMLARLKRYPYIFFRGLPLQTYCSSLMTAIVPAHFHLCFHSWLRLEPV